MRGNHKLSEKVEIRLLFMLASLSLLHELKVA